MIKYFHGLIWDTGVEAGEWNRGLEMWLGEQDHLLLFQRLRFGSQHLYLVVHNHLEAQFQRPSAGPLRHCIWITYRQTHRYKEIQCNNVLIITNKINLNKYKFNKF